METHVSDTRSPVLPVSTNKSGEPLQTGSWRFQRPVVDLDRCTGCGICVVFCPESCIRLDSAGGIKIMYDYCKGCGICDVECPLNAIKMVEEAR
jgi:pyruvate ferredoxin oxidoreductase delta subunit